MSIEIDFFWKYFVAIANRDSQELAELQPETEMDREYLCIISRLDSFNPAIKNFSLKKYIRLQEASMVRLIARIENYLKLKHKLSATEFQLLIRLLELTDKLVDHLLSYYKYEFDYNMQTSGSRKLKHLSENRAILSELCNQNIVLAEWIASCGEQLLAGGDGSSISFRRILYEKKLTKLLKDKISELETEFDLHKILIYAGHETGNYSNEIMRFIAGMIQSEGSLGDKYKLVITIKKEISQIPRAKSKLFKKGSGKIRKQTLSYLKEELNFLKGLDFVTSEFVNSGILDSSYKVSLSVKQLAFYVFLNVESGVITEQRAKRVHEYVVKNLSTTDTASISEKSFKNAYYLHAPEDVRKVMDRLAKMLAIAENHL